MTNESIFIRIFNLWPRKFFLPGREWCPLERFWTISRETETSHFKWHLQITAGNYQNFKSTLNFWPIFKFWQRKMWFHCVSKSLFNSESDFSMIHILALKYYNSLPKYKRKLIFKKLKRFSGQFNMWNLYFRLGIVVDTYSYYP